MQSEQNKCRADPRRTLGAIKQVILRCREKLERRCDTDRRGEYIINECART